jgi:aryl-alcohol dehydrogenase-like predicted oxidoreductase
VAEGKVREIGCSNFDGAMLEEAEAAVVDGAPGFVSVQNQYNVLHRDAEDEVLDFCARTRTGFLPYFPLASGVLSGKYRAGEDAPAGTRLAAWGERGKSQLTDERLGKVTALDALARGEGHTVLELAFAWLLSHPPVASVIAGATKPEQVAANVAAGRWTPSAEVLAEVAGIAPR